METSIRMLLLAVKNGIYAYGSLPEVDDLFVRQGREVDPK